MVPRLSWVMLLGFGALIALAGLLGFSAIHRGGRLYEETLATHNTYLQTESLLRGITADLHISGVHIRDYLLDPSGIAAGLYREQLLNVRHSIDARLDRVEHELDSESAAALGDLKREVEAYWDSLEPVFDWTPQQRLTYSHAFLRNHVLPRRIAVLNLAEQVGAVHAINLRREQERLRESRREFRRVFTRLTIGAMALGLAVTIVTMYRVFALERKNQREMRRAESAEDELRRLSQRLVKAQEQERKELSRELHDEIGQLLTGMRMELNSLGALRTAPRERFEQRMSETRDLIEQTIRTVRDLAMGLRPSMLDDIGLGPALEWLGRDFSRRSGIPAEVRLDGSLDGLPEEYRTCVFRVVQEAVTNCARHAQARHVRILVHGSEDRVAVSVQDDGLGLPAGGPTHRGLGLLGIEERARELGGTFHISSQPGRGTMLSVELPVSPALHGASESTYRG